MRLSLIVAMASNRVIGKDNRLPWRLPADLRHFRRLTMGCPLIMGRRTYESIGRPLAGRRMIVLTRSRTFRAEGVQPAHSLTEAVGMASGSNEVFVAGGAQIYAAALGRANRIYLTLIQGELEGDTYFPDFPPEDWLLVRRDDHDPDEENPYPYSFLVYDRREGGNES